MEYIKNDESKIKYICPNCLKDFTARSILNETYSE